MNDLAKLLWRNDEGQDIAEYAVTGDLGTVPKLSPRHVAKNPVMFVVEVGSVLTTSSSFGMSPRTPLTWRRCGSRRASPPGCGSRSCSPISRRRWQKGAARRRRRRCARCGRRRRLAGCAMAARSRPPRRRRCATTPASARRATSSPVTARLSRASPPWMNPRSPASRRL